MIFSKREFQNVAEKTEGTTVHFWARGLGVLGSLQEMVKFRRLVVRVRPDIVHVQFGRFYSLFVMLSMLFSRVPYIITFRGTDLNHNPSYSYLRSIVGIIASQISVFGADSVICVSQQLKQRIWRKNIPIHIVPSGVDTTLFYPTSRSAAREELGWRLDDRVVLFNASKNPKVKRLELAKAAVEILKQTTSAKLVILDGNQAADSIPTYMNAADCLLVTSLSEGSPSVVQEALACNLPIVSVDVGDVRQVIEGLENCCLTEGSPEKISAALDRVLTAGKRSDGQSKVSEYSLQLLTQKILEIYRGVIS